MRRILIALAILLSLTGYSADTRLGGDGIVPGTQLGAAGINTPAAAVPSAFTYRRPGGVDRYKRPGGTDNYLRP